MIHLGVTICEICHTQLMISARELACTGRTIATFQMIHHIIGIEWQREGKR